MGYTVDRSLSYPFLIGRVAKGPAPDEGTPAVKMPPVAAAAARAAKGGRISDGLFKHWGL
jgi:hypothetical protein